MDLNHLSKAKEKYIRSLHTLKHRQKYNKYIAEGHKICKEIIISKASKIQHIVATEKWIAENKEIVHSYSEILSTGTTKDLKQITVLSTPSEVLLVADKPVFDDKDLLKSRKLLLYLDGIRNPGNMGAILRIADWYGMKTVICSDDCVEIFNPKVIQASMGSFLRVHTQSLDLESIKKEGFIVLGASMEGKGVEEVDINHSCLLVIGNEGKGVSENSKLMVDQWVRIDGSKRLGAESLNAAVATGILIDQIVRKKG